MQNNLLASDQTYTSKFYETDVQKIVQLNRSIFEPDADAINEAFELLKFHQGNIMYSFDPLNDQENADVLGETTDDLDTDESFNVQIPSDLDSAHCNNQSASATISTYNQPTEVSDDVLRQNVRSLNKQQRLA